MKLIIGMITLVLLAGCTDVIPEVKQLRFPKSVNDYSKSFVQVYSGAVQGTTSGSSTTYGVRLYIHDGEKPTSQATASGDYLIQNPEIQ